MSSNLPHPPGLHEALLTLRPLRHPRHPRRPHRRHHDGMSAAHQGWGQGSGQQILHQLIGGLYMFIPLLIGFQPSVVQDFATNHSISGSGTSWNVSQTSRLSETKNWAMADVDDIAMA